MAPDREDEGRPFVQRWSRRKRERQAEDRREEPVAEQAPPASPADTEGQSEENLLHLESNREAAEAIDLDSLTGRSDLTPFFKAGVPKTLKSAAMRALWRSDPVLANLDGLNDYDENFGDPELVRKFAGTAWKVGKGYIFADQEDEPETAAVAEETVETHDAPLSEQAADPSAPESGEAEAEFEHPEPERENSGEDPELQTPGGSDDEPEKVPLRQRLALDSWHED